MEILRKTSNDYRKELHKLKLDEMALEKRIRTRANEMCEQNPDVIIGREIDNKPLKKHVKTKDYINRLEDVQLSTVFTVMEIIEEDIANKHLKNN